MIRALFAFPMALWRWVNPPDNGTGPWTRCSSCGNVRRDTDAEQICGLCVASSRRKAERRVAKHYREDESMAAAWDLGLWFMRLFGRPRP
jgi:hypothetical protein